MMDRARGGYLATLAEQHVEVQFPEVDQPASLMVGRACLRAGSGQQRQHGMKSERTNPLVSTCWLPDNFDRLPSLATPDANRSIITLRGNHPPVRGEGDDLDNARVPF